MSGSTAAAIDLTTPPREADASSWSTQPITVRARTSPTRLAKRAWRSSVTNPCGTPAEAMVPLTKGGLCWARRVLVGAARRRLDWSRPDPAPLRLTAVDRRVSENFTHTILGRQLTKFRRKRLPGAARARPAGRLQPQQQPGKRRASPGRPSAVHRGARRRVPGPVPLRRGTR